MQRRPSHCAAVAIVLVACSRPHGAPTEGDAAPMTPAPPSTPAPTVTGEVPVESSRIGVSPLEARRVHLARAADDPVLAKNLEVVRSHFDGGVPPNLDVQIAEVTSSNRRAYLVSASDGSRPPLAFLVDARGALSWSKDRPTAGITPPVGRLAIAPGPRGKIALVACDPPTASVAARLWEDDGAPFADFQALDIDGCEDVSVLHWPKRGWIIVASRPGETRAQLLTEAGTMAWGRGITLGSPWHGTSPASLALDTPDTFVLVQYAGAAGTDRAVAHRYDARGAAVWKAPLDLGQVPSIAPGSERITLALPREGVVRATLVKNTVVDFKSSGEIVR